MKKLITILVVMALVVAFTATSQIQRGKKPAQSKPKTEQPQGQNNSTSSKNNKAQKSDSSPKTSKPSSRSGSSSSSSQSSTHEVPALVTTAEPTALDVAFSCNVNEADMYIDGNEYGRPKGTRTLKTGDHQVKLVAEGYEDYTTTIHVAAGSTSFDFKMTKKAPTEPYVPKVETFTVKGVSFDMVFVQGGTFTMGATEEQGSDAYSVEKPVHQVTLSDYYIGKTEVTQELWKAVMGKNHSSYKNDPKNPVRDINFQDCTKFIKKLNRITGKVFRIPAEAEWEYAARGGNQSCSYKYSGSNTIEEVAWYSDNCGLASNGTHPVGTKSPNELGLFDMSGNVEEWCQDRLDSRSEEGTGSDYRVLRGGTWRSEARNCRVSYRNYWTSSLGGMWDCGMRLAL